MKYNLLREDFSSSAKCFLHEGLLALDNGLGQTLFLEFLVDLYFKSIEVKFPLCKNTRKMLNLFKQ